MAVKKMVIEEFVKIFNKLKVLKCLLISIVLCTSCGKDFNFLNGNDNDNPSIDPILVSEKEKIAQGHRIFCEKPEKCNESIAKLIVFDKDSLIERTCAGFLVSDNTLVTSASCLGASLRVPFTNCSNDVYVHFPEVGEIKREMVGCDKILTSSFIENGKDPATVYSDVVYLSLSKPVERKYLTISRNGFIENINNYIFWGLRKENNNISLITKEYCRPIFGSYANPLTNHEHSPNMVLAGCNYDSGTRGSPVVDSFGYVRGLVNATISNEMKDYFYNENLINGNYLIDKLNFVTNFACVTTPESAFSKGFPTQCNVELTESAINSKRQNMLNDDRIHHSYFLNLRKKLEENSQAGKYVRWLLEFDKVGLNHFRSKLIPQCFANYSKWATSIKRKSSHSEEFMVYIGETKLMFDTTLKPMVVSINTRNTYHTITFQPRKLRETPALSSIEIDGRLASQGLGLCE